LTDLEIKEAIEEESPDQTVPASKGPILALELLLLSMARTQSLMSVDNPDVATTFETLRRSWSDTYRIQLTA
jgi:hypothetical protein